LGPFLALFSALFGPLLAGSGLPAPFWRAGAVVGSRASRGPPFGVPVLASFLGPFRASFPAPPWPLIFPLSFASLGPGGPKGAPFWPLFGWFLAPFPGFSALMSVQSGFRGPLGGSLPGRPGFLALLGPFWPSFGPPRGPGRGPSFSPSVSGRALRARPEGPKGAQNGPPLGALLGAPAGPPGGPRRGPSFSPSLLAWPGSARPKGPQKGPKRAPFGALLGPFLALFRGPLGPKWALWPSRLLLASRALGAPAGPQRGPAGPRGPGLALGSGFGLFSGSLLALFCVPFLASVLGPFPACGAWFWGGPFGSFWAPFLAAFGPKNPVFRAPKP